MTGEDKEFVAKDLSAFSPDDTGVANGNYFGLPFAEDEAELVLLSGENKDEDFVYNSYFFRYTKDGRLLYLGMTTCDVLNPTVSFTALETRP